MLYAICAVGYKGLARAYAERAGQHRLMRKVMVLPLLPADHMRREFDVLVDGVPESANTLRQLLEYVRTTWLENTVWSLANLSCFGRQVRTNNDVEGWHRRLNQLARRGSLPFYLLVRLLHDESSTVSVQVHLMSDGRLRRYARRKYTTLNGRLLKLWKEYSDGERSASSLLRAASRLQLPNWLAPVTPAV